jgi:glycosyltransferase involved in cell wall biosynthesis
MRKLRLAIVAPTLRILGGQAVQADRLLRGWRDDADVDAWLVPINPLPPAGLRFAIEIKYLRTIVTEATYIRRLARALAKADVVHVFSASYSSFLLAPLPAIAVARMLAAVNRNVVPSRFLADVFQRFGLEASVVSNTIDLEQFPFRERDPLRPRILSTRNLGYPYNIACTLRAFHEVQQRRPDASLTLVGGGPDEAGLRALAADLGVRNVHFAGRLAPDAIARAYADHDIYLQSPDIDNMPLSVLEAFASGLPVVSTDVGGVPVMLTHGQHGWLAPRNDHQALAAQVLQLLDHPARARRVARAARETCEACTWSRVREEWLRLYFSVLTETGNAVPQPYQARAVSGDPS